MKNFLSDYIFSTASKSQEKIQNILAASQASKEDLDQIADRISNIATRSPITVRPESYGGLITNTGLDSVQRDTDIRMRELYDDSNLVSLLLDTNTEILSGEVKKQRDQLLTFEKFIENYSFMLADGGFYDYAYTESFNDEIQKETSSLLSGMLYDRSGKSFDEQAESLHVDQGTGSLVMDPGFQVTYPFNPTISKNNAAAYITSDTGIDKVNSNSTGEGWRVAVSSPRPISSALYPGLEKGCQFEVEMFLNEPALCDSISIFPMADLPIQILSLKVYSEGNTEFQEFVNSSVRLDRNMTFYFARQNVARIALVINQPVYTRGKLPPVQSEIDYKEAVVAQPYFSQDKKSIVDVRTNSAFRRIFKKWSLFNDSPKVSMKIPAAQIDKYSPDKLNSKEALSYEKDQYNLYSRFKVDSKKQSIFVRWMIQKMFKDQPDLLDRFSIHRRGPYTPNANITTVLDEEQPTTDLESLNYEYTLGIRSLRLGISDRPTRGVFISKPVPAPVQGGVVRIRVEDVNYYLAQSYLDNKFVTSIEYSITNRSNPTKEEDWIPIVPSNYKDEIINERLFPQSSGYAPFRFGAKNSDSITVYKNGVQIIKDSLVFVQSDDLASIRGVRIPSSEFSLNQDDVYTVGYLPQGDKTTIVFSDYGFKDKSLASAFDDNGAGELFSGSGVSNSITLRNYPYVDYQRIELEGTYSQTTGLVSDYQPISIVLSDGTIVHNYTNYNGLIQNELRADDVNYAFVHSNANIVFNKAINQPFRVYYQYEPSYLRYRIIFRVNVAERTSPQVDSITIKTKMGSSILGLNNKRV